MDGYYSCSKLNYSTDVNKFEDERPHMVGSRLSSLSLAVQLHIQSLQKSPELRD